MPSSTTRQSVDGGPAPQSAPRHSVPLGGRARFAGLQLALQAAAARLYATENRRFALWLPVCLGAGIWLYFALATEPHWGWGLVWVLPALVLASGWARQAGWIVLALTWVLASGAAGFGLAVLSAHRADAPRILYPVGETVEGRVLSLSRSASGAPRLLLDRLQIYGFEDDQTPERIRLTVLKPGTTPLPAPGQRIRVYASLMPTGGPVEPGAFDFRRRAFFERLGGIGLTRGEVLMLGADPADGLWDRARLWLAQRRAALSAYLRQAMPGREGSFAAAIIVGDRSGIDDADAEALRASNLAHLLAISGLHMGILTGLVFAFARFVLALPPGLALRWPTKKFAAVIALGAGLAYLGLSGATVATQRAFIMVAVAFCAVLVDRPAITLRALALAATIVLVIRPISLLDVGFQMSFAATAALVWGFDIVRRNRTGMPRLGIGGWTSKLARTLLFYVAALLFSSLLAGLATAPFAAYHFNRTAPYGLLANLLAVPAMGLWIAPCACLAAVLAPFGLSDWALRAMGWGIEHVLRVAHWVADLPGAVQPIQAAPPIVLGLISLGGLWVILWRGSWRAAGAVGVLAGLIVWSHAPDRPGLIIAPDARLIGVMSDKGRALDHERAQGFAAKTWLRRDGDWADQAQAATRAEFARVKGGLSSPLPEGWRLEARWSKRVTPEELQALCQAKTLLVARRGPPVEGPCVYFGKDELRRYGAISVAFTPEGLTLRKVREPGRWRLWSQR